MKHRQAKFSRQFGPQYSLRAGTITAIVGTPRQIQFGLKLVF